MSKKEKLEDKEIDSLIKDLNVSYSKSKEEIWKDVNSNLNIESKPKTNQESNNIFQLNWKFSIAASILIIIGVFSLPLLIADFLEHIRPWLFGGAAVWLFGYGVIRIRELFDNKVLKIDSVPVGSLWATLGVAAALTFINPHVYLDTVVLIGTISLQFSGVNKLAFGVGAATASFVFFPALGYGGYLLSDMMRRPRAWRVLNGIIAVIMFVLAATILRAGGWY